MQRRLQTFLFGIAIVAIVSLVLSYNRLVRSVELAASSAGFVDAEPTTA